MTGIEIVLFGKSENSGENVIDRLEEALRLASQTDMLADDWQIIGE